LYDDQKEKHGKKNKTQAQNQSPENRFGGTGNNSKKIGGINGNRQELDTIILQ